MKINVNHDEIMEKIFVCLPTDLDCTTKALKRLRDRAKDIPKVCYKLN